MFLVRRRWGVRSGGGRRRRRCQQFASVQEQREKRRASVTEMPAIKLELLLVEAQVMGAHWRSLIIIPPFHDVAHRSGPVRKCLNRIDREPLPKAKVGIVIERRAMQLLAMILNYAVCNLAHIIAHTPSRHSLKVSLQAIPFATFFLVGGLRCLQPQEGRRARVSDF